MTALSLSGFDYWLPVLHDRLREVCDRFPVPADATERDLSYQFGERALVYRWSRGGQEFGYKVDSRHCHQVGELGSYRSMLIPVEPVKAPSMLRFQPFVDGIFGVVLDLELRQVDFLSTDVELAFLVADTFNKEFRWETPPLPPDVWLQRGRSQAVGAYSADMVRRVYDRLPKARFVDIHDPDTQELLGTVSVLD